MIDFEARGTILLAMRLINGVNRREQYIKLIRVRVEGFIYIRGCGFVLHYTID